MQSWTPAAVAVLGFSMSITAAPLPQNFYYYHGQKISFSIQTAGEKSSSNMEIEFSSGVKAQVKPRLAFLLKKGALVSQIPNLKNLHPLSAKYNQSLFYLDVATPDLAIVLSQKLAESPSIVFAHPIFDFPIEARSIDPSQEPYFTHQNHLHNTGQRGGTFGADINVLPAWQSTTGNSETKIALIDLGFEQSHPDLVDAWAINRGEIPGNKIDDDHNGLVDDVMGWNFDLNNNSMLYGAANSHGTATAGLIAAQANGIGIAGVCPGCKVLPILIYTDIEDAVAAFYYARDQGAKVISNSWGYKIGTPQTELLEAALTDVAKNSNNGKGISIIFAMPNHHSNACRSTGLDISGHPDVIAISSVDRNDRKVDEAGYGPCLKFVGPTGPDKNGGITTTDRVGENGYNKPGIAHDDLEDQDYTQSFYGTSAAAPVIAGVFGLLYSLKPDLSAEKIYEIIRDSADKVSRSEANYDQNRHSDEYGFGRPNAGAAIELAISRH